MPEKKQPGDFVEMLLEQDSPLDDGRYSLHRDQLNQRLRRAVRDEKIVRIATVIVWILPLIMYLLFATLWPHMNIPPAGFAGDVVFPTAIFLAAACGLLAVPMLALYVLRYRHAVDRARGDARDAMLIRLQETVARLATRLQAPSVFDKVPQGNAPDDPLPPG